MSDCEVIVSPQGSISGELSPSGLKNGGRHTEVTLSDAAWTALPDIGALTNRNAIAVQNFSGFEVKVKYTTPAGYVGMRIPDQGERFYNITDAITIYAKFEPGGSGAVDVEEIS